MRLIDADKIMADIASAGRSTSKDYILLTIARYIRIQPTIDAEPVIRCKDCEYYNGEERYCCNDIFTKPKGYCSYGRKK